VVRSVQSGDLGQVGLAALILVGPAAEMFRSPLTLLVMSGFLLLTAVALFRRLRIGAAAGAAWAIIVIGLSGIALTQISVSYSVPARVFMFVPVAAINLAVLIALWRTATPFFSARTG